MSPVRVSHYPRRDGPLPEGVRWVGRPTVWGNPHRPGDSVCIDAADAVAKYRWTWRYFFDHPELGQQFRSQIAELADAVGLACACPLDQPCHVDVLLELIDEVTQ